MAFTEKDYELADTKDRREAKAQLIARFKLGKNQKDRLIQHCANNIPRDSYVSPASMMFVTDVEKDGILHLRYDGDPKKVVALHAHALGQLCSIVDLPALWRKKLDVPVPWRRALLVNDLNTLYENVQLLNARKQPAKYLHRKVGNELRAVLTQSYNRHLISTAVLQPFLAVCEEVGLVPVHAHVTDLKVGLQTYLPVAFEPVPGEFVALGAWWGNSDFGQGKVRISHTVMRIASGASLLTEDTFSRVHLGAVVQDTDMVLSDEVAIKELEAVAAATRSAVRVGIEPDNVKKTLKAIQLAYEAHIAWSVLKHKLDKFLNMDEVKSLETALNEKIKELPSPGVGSDGKPLASRWWAAAAVANLASKQMDEGRAADLKLAAGKFLDFTEETT